MSLRLGLIGLGNMGSGIALKFLKAYSNLTVYDVSTEIKEKYNTPHYKSKGLKFAFDLKELCEKCNLIWLMVPASAVDNILKKISDLNKSKLIIVDGGNSFFKDTQRRAKELKKYNIDLLDCGTSGGLYGAENGFSLTVGGDYQVYEKIKELFSHIAYNDQAYIYVGPSGAGHYVKMVHNGIEYALLQAYAEGFSLLQNNCSYPNLNLENISKTWLEGSIIRSWILGLLNKILKEKINLNEISGSVDMGGTAEWAIEEAEKENIRVALIKEAVKMRLESQKTGGDYATKLIALMRYEMGGHNVYGSCNFCKNNIGNN